MTTLGENIRAVGIDGKFDDCQALVKTAFSDSDLSRMRLTSANSINIGRVLPQIVYYVYAYAKTATGNEPVVFSIPSGNFGNMMGAVMARRMGLPVERLVIATNANREVPDFLMTDSYSKIVPSIECISNAMNVGHPSNLARLIDLYGGRMDETGTIHEQPAMDSIRRDIWSISIDDVLTRDTIRRAWEEHGLLLEPHGAVAWAAAEKFPNSGRTRIISVETAHPAKFPEEIESLLGFSPETPPALSGLDEKPEDFARCPNSYSSLKELILSSYSR